MSESGGYGGHEVVATEDDFSTEEPMGVEVERSGPTSVIRLSGEIDMLTTPALRAKVTEELGAGLSVLVLDMLAVESRNRGVSLRLVADSRPVSRPLQATGLTDLFEIHSTVEEALAA